MKNNTAIHNYLPLPFNGKLWFGSTYFSEDMMVDTFEDLKSKSVSIICNLLEPNEDTFKDFESESFDVINIPIKDFSIPLDVKDFKNKLNQILFLLDDGRSIYVHCWGGHGRTGTVLLSIKVLLGHDIKKSIEEIRLLANGPETEQQIIFATSIILG
jgi:protein-tyrosine phosphatase